MNGLFRIAVAALLIAATSFSSAQVSYVTVTGTVTDPNSNPYANATYLITLVNSIGKPIQSAVTPNGQLYTPKLIQGHLDANAHFSVSLVPTSILNGGSGAYWKFAISGPADPSILASTPPWVINYQTAISISVDLSRQISALATPATFTNQKTSLTAVDSTAKTSASAAQSTASSAQTVANPALPSNGATPTGIGSSNKVAFPDTISAGAVIIPKSSPDADIRAFGAVIDGATDISSAINDAASTANTTSGTVFLPCTNHGCFLSNGSIPTPAAGVGVQYQIQGTLILGSTLIIPSNVNLLCAGGSAPGQFTARGPNCTIVAPQAKGTIGTSVSTGSHSFTPTFTLGSTANLLNGSAISISGTTTCNISHITRTSATFNNVTATVSTSGCRIPAGKLITVAGVVDGTFDGTPILLSNDAFNSSGTLNLVWTQTGQSPSTSSGGVITGFNDDSYETVVLSGTGPSYTATFAHTHFSSDVWGEVGVMFAPSTFSGHYMQGVTVTRNFGAGFWANHNAEVLLDGDSFSGIAWEPSIAAEFDSTFGIRFTNSMFGTTTSHLCGFSCGTQSYPKGLRITSLTGSPDPSDLNIVGDGNTFILGGIKVDMNGQGGPALNKFGDYNITDITIEQPTGEAILVDPRHVGTARAFTLTRVNLQDNFWGYPQCMLSYTDPSFTGSLIINTLNASLLNGCITGKYYGGQLLINGVDYTQGTLGLPTYFGRGFTINDGYTTETELRSNFNFSPAILPSSSQTATTNSASWSCIGCTVKTGLEAPDGSFTAGELFANTSTNGGMIVVSFNTTTSAGDWIISGVDCMPGTGMTALESCQDSSSFGTYLVFSFGATDVFNNSGKPFASPQNQSRYRGDWWERIVSADKITTGTFTSHNIKMTLYSPQTIGSGVRFSQPFLFYIPVGAIPSDIGGALTSGSFVLGETVRQTTSGATATALNSTSSILAVNLIVGTPDNSHKWTGGTSGAVFSPATMPSATMTTSQWDKEIARWRQQLLHGYIPSNLTSFGNVLTINPLHKFYWGNDTNLYRRAAGTLQTDGNFDIGSGKVYQVDGKQIASSNLSDGSSLTKTIASGTATMTTALIASGACGSIVTVPAAGVASTDAIAWTYNATVGANPGTLIVSPSISNGSVSFVYCNPTTAGVTPSAATLNWRVTR